MVNRPNDPWGMDVEAPEGETEAESEIQLAPIAMALAICWGAVIGGVALIHWIWRILTAK